MTDRPAPSAQELIEGARAVTQDDVARVLAREHELKARLHGPLARFVEDAQLLLAMVRARSSGAYPDTPWATLAAGVFALLYVLNPADMVPDVLPLIGLLDDATVIAICLGLIEGDLHAFKAWRARPDPAAPGTPAPPR